MQECITWVFTSPGERGTTLNGTQGVGIANAAGSLSAIRRLVFEESMVTLSELVEILRKDYKGKEYLGQYVLNRVPQYGNDEDIPDDLDRSTQDDIIGRTEQSFS
jgi:pyruvate-formate lyase